MKERIGIIGIVKTVVAGTALVISIAALVVSQPTFPHLIRHVKADTVQMQTIPTSSFDDKNFTIHVDDAVVPVIGIAGELGNDTLNLDFVASGWSYKQSSYDSRGKYWDIFVYTGNNQDGLPEVIAKKGTKIPLYNENVDGSQTKSIWAKTIPENEYDTYDFNKLLDDLRY